MQIIAQCPRCGHTEPMPASAAQCRRRCQKCRELFKIPPLEQAQKAVNIIKNAHSELYVDTDGNLYG